MMMIDDVNAGYDNGDDYYDLFKCLSLLASLDNDRSTFMSIQYITGFRDNRIPIEA
jgi:hypothetical protein